MDMDTHSQNLLSGSGSYIPAAGAGDKSDSEIGNVSDTGLGQGGGHEHIKFGGAEPDNSLRNDAESESVPEDVFDNFGNSIEKDEEEDTSVAPVV
ncbi:MAG: hypothetical protein HGA31_00425 [Candidatus Moranbacteria bacterium]|nr:hypothetical protein [Candidatus Moranbacteria bacterium]